MAIKLENKTNVEAPSSTYPYGAIKDDTGAFDGTPVDVQVYGDIHQFFAKLLDASGVIANDLPDNFDNSFQYFEALYAVINGTWATNVNLPDSVIKILAVEMAAANSLSVSYKEIGNNFHLILTGAITLISSGFSASDNLVIDLSGLMTKNFVDNAKFSLVVKKTYLGAEKVSIPICFTHNKTLNIMPDGDLLWDADNSYIFVLNIVLPLES